MDRFYNSKDAKQSIYDIFRACRLCGAGGGYKMPIIQSIANASDIVDEVELRQKIRECVQIEVHQDDKMPPLICELCVDKVNDFYEFLEMCRQTNKRTRLSLGLPPQTLPQGAPDAGDCILGVTEPVYVNDDSNDGEPLSFQKQRLSNARAGSKRRSSPLAAAPANKKSSVPVMKLTRSGSKDSRTGVKDFKVNSRSGRDAGRSRRAALSPPPGPAPRRTTRFVNEDDSDSSLSRLSRSKDKGKKTTPPAKVPQKGILKKKTEVEEEESSLLREKPRPLSKRAREREDSRTLKKVKISESRSERRRAPSPPPPAPAARRRSEHPCPVCRTALAKPSALQSHLRQMHAVAFTPTRLACNACGEWFGSAEEAATHHRWHRSAPASYHCRLCTADFRQLTSYTKHFDMRACVPSEEVPDVQCSECWKMFATDNLRARHKCPGEDGRPGGKCAKCQKKYTTYKNLRKHEEACVTKRKGAETSVAAVSPELLRHVQPMQVRVARCDVLLSDLKQEHCNVSHVGPEFGLDKNCDYPYISSVSTVRIKMEPDSLDYDISNIKQEIKDEPIDYEDSVMDRDSDYDSESSHDSPPGPNLVLNPFARKKKAVETLSTISLRTIFSSKCLGKIHKKKKKKRPVYIKPEDIKKEKGDDLDSLFDNSKTTDKDTKSELINEYSQDLENALNATATNNTANVEEGAEVRCLELNEDAVPINLAESIENESTSSNESPCNVSENDKTMTLDSEKCDLIAVAENDRSDLEKEKAENEPRADNLNSLELPKQPDLVDVQLVQEVSTETSSKDYCADESDIGEVIKPGERTIVELETDARPSDLALQEIENKSSDQTVSKNEDHDICLESVNKSVDQKEESTQDKESPQLDIDKKNQATSDDETVLDKILENVTENIDTCSDSAFESNPKLEGANQDISLKSMNSNAGEVIEETDAELVDDIDTGEPISSDNKIEVSESKQTNSEHKDLNQSQSLTRNMIEDDDEDFDIYSMLSEDVSPVDTKSELGSGTNQDNPQITNCFKSKDTRLIGNKLDSSLDEEQIVTTVIENVTAEDVGTKEINTLDNIKTDVQSDILTDKLKVIEDNSGLQEQSIAEDAHIRPTEEEADCVVNDSHRLKNSEGNCRSSDSSMIRDSINSGVEDNKSSDIIKDDTRINSVNVTSSPSNKSDVIDIEPPAQPSSLGLNEIKVNGEDRDYPENNFDSDGDLDSISDKELMDQLNAQIGCEDDNILAQEPEADALKERFHSPQLQNEDTNKTNSLHNYVEDMDLSQDMTEPDDLQAPKRFSAEEERLEDLREEQLENNLLRDQEEDTSTKRFNKPDDLGPRGSEVETSAESASKKQEIEDKITLDDLLAQQTDRTEKGADAMDFDCISDDEFNFDT